MAGNSFGARAGLDVGDRSLEVFRLDALGSVGDVGGLPFSLKVLLENLLRHNHGVYGHRRGHRGAGRLGPGEPPGPARSPSCRPASSCRTSPGVPAVVDLAAMRDAIATLGRRPGPSTRWSPAELVIDHSIVADCPAPPTPSP